MIRQSETQTYIRERKADENNLVEQCQTEIEEEIQAEPISRRVCKVFAKPKSRLFRRGLIVHLIRESGQRMGRILFFDGNHTRTEDGLIR